MNSLVITLPGSIRSKKNSKRIFARGRFKKVLPSEAYEAWELEARLYVRAKNPGLFVDGPLLCPVNVEAHFFYRGPRPDLQGCMESVADAMEGILWADDKQIESWDGSRVHHSVDNPHTLLVVRWE